MATQRILIVDDEAPVRDVLIKFFKKEGFEVHDAASGTEALALVEEKDFDVVLTDLKMPGPDGIEVLREIKRIAPETAVLILTGYPTRETTAEAMALDGDGYVSKPIELNQLKSLVLQGLVLSKWKRHP